MPLDFNAFNLFLKMISEEYGLAPRELDIIKNRLLADPEEFEKIWTLYRLKSGDFNQGVDPFKFVLMDLML